MVAGTAALAIAGTSLAYAQQRAGRDGMTQGRQLNAEDLRAFGEARLAALKAGLVLTPEQEKNWPAFEQAARDLAKARMERISAMRNAPANNDPVERLRQRATALSETGAALTALCDPQSLGRTRPRWVAWTRRTRRRRNASLGPAPIRSGHARNGTASRITPVVTRQESTPAVARSLRRHRRGARPAVG